MSLTYIDNFPHCLIILMKEQESNLSLNCNNMILNNVFLFVFFNCTALQVKQTEAVLGAPLSPRGMDCSFFFSGDEQR